MRGELLLRVSYRDAIQTKLDDEHEHSIRQEGNYEVLHANNGIVQEAGQQPTILNPKLRLPPLRLSMHGGSYF